MRIGTIELDKPLALAPMDDVTDPPFRKICKEYGADLLYTEFVNCEALIRNVEKSMRRLRVADDERPVGIQIYGSGEGSMEEATRLAESHAPDFIDINAGCWVKKIAMRGDGAGLLRDLGKFEQVVTTVVNATTLPVTVKTRLGWDDDSICILDVARMVEQCGAQVLSVHCRTRCQGYRGQADWSWLPKIKAVCGLPLIGNGDVKTPEDVKTLFDLGCDGVMIGRGAITNPWIFQDAKNYLAKGRYQTARTLNERVALCLRHLKDRADYCGERRAVLEHRKHYANYLKGYRNAARLRASLMEFETIAPVEARLRDYCEAYRDDRDEPDSRQ